MLNGRIMTRHVESSGAKHSPEVVAVRGPVQRDDDRSQSHVWLLVFVGASRAARVLERGCVTDIPSSRRFRLCVIVCADTVGGSLTHPIGYAQHCYLRLP